ncbi:tetratricopeptide repeat protein [Pseudoxanthomonas sp. NC8]|nr:tetratricopeptide repeat protein [Pseudoxanthomonas sp. NC8]
MGDYRAATAYYTRALDIEGRLLGEDSVDYAVTLNNFASLEESRGNVGEAVRMYRRSFELRKAKLGPENGTTLRAEANWGGR